MTWKVAWITGASSGIGREVALRLARAGTAVAVSARSKDKLDALAAEHAQIHAYPVDATDAAALAATAQAIATDLGVPDLALYAAGTWKPGNTVKFNVGNMTSTLAVNYGGALNWLGAIVPAMLAREAGHIAMVGSVSAYAGLPLAGSYGPTKAALNNLAETMRAELGAKGITVSIINPGFVETPMTADNDFPMPFIISADDAAKRIVDGLETGRFEIAFPRRMVWMLKGMRLLPSPVFFWLMRNVVMRKPEKDEA